MTLFIFHGYYVKHDTINRLHSKINIFSLKVEMYGANALLTERDVSTVRTDQKLGGNWACNVYAAASGWRLTWAARLLPDYTPRLPIMERQRLRHS